MTNGQAAMIREDMGRINESLKMMLARLAALTQGAALIGEGLRQIDGRLAALARPRTELGDILAGLKARGVITQADVERLESGEG